MGAPEKYTVEQIEAAMHRKRAMLTLVAEDLGASYATIRKYVDRSPRLQAIRAFYREKRVDTAELALDNAVLNGEAWAISLVLKTLGKSRGYVERQEVSGSLTVTTFTADDAAAAEARLRDWRARNE